MINIKKYEPLGNAENAERRLALYHHAITIFKLIAYISGQASQGPLHRTEKIIDLIKKPDAILNRAGHVFLDSEFCYSLKYETS